MQIKNSHTSSEWGYNKGFFVLGVHRASLLGADRVLRVWASQQVLESTHNFCLGFPIARRNLRLLEKSLCLSWVLFLVSVEKVHPLGSAKKRHPPWLPVTESLLSTAPHRLVPWAFPFNWALLCRKHLLGYKDRNCVSFLARCCWHYWSAIHVDAIVNQGLDIWFSI